MYSTRVTKLKFCRKTQIRAGILEHGNVAFSMNSELAIP